MDEMDALFALVVCAVLLFCAAVIHDLGCVIQHEDDYGLGSVVTTTAEYEYLTNDSFTGVVVRGEGCRDPALTVRNRDGDERRIATQFLEPMR